MLTWGRGLPKSAEAFSEAEIIRLNDQLLGEMAAAPSLKPEQQAFVKKLYQDQVKSRGGFDAIKLTLGNAGVPFSAEQIARIKLLFAEHNQPKFQLLKESRSPDRATIDQLQRESNQFHERRLQFSV